MSDPQAIQEAQEARQSRWTWIVPLVLAAALIGAYFVWPAYGNFVDKAWTLLTSGDQERFEQWIRGFGAWGPAVLGILAVMQTILAFIPSTLLAVVAVLAYGPWWGGLVAWVALLFSATLGYFIGRAFGPVTVERLIGPEKQAKISTFVQHYGFWAIIAARVAPAISTDAVSLAAGLVKMNYLRFITATGLGTLPLVAFIAYFGESLEQLKTGLIWATVITAVLFIAWVVYDRRKRHSED